MPGSMPASRPLLLAAILVLAAVLPAAADHVYSHQYRVFGRVVGPEGEPLAGAIVHLKTMKTREEQQTAFESNCTGDFGFSKRRDKAEWFHTHGISTVAQIDVEVFDVAANRSAHASVVPMDRNLRKSHLDFRLDDAGGLLRCPGAAEDHARTAFVFGRLWNSTKETSLEGVSVWGEIPGGDESAAGCRVGGGLVQCMEVVVNVTTSDGRTQQATTWSDNYGDYGAWFRFDEPFEGGTATAASIGREATRPIDPVFHTAEVDLLLGEPQAPRQAPGAAAWALLAALGAAALLGGRRV